MSQPNSSHIMNNLTTKLLPFIKTVILYFVLAIPKEEPSAWAVLVKCAPIYSLVYFVLMTGVRFEKECAYAHKIVVALLLSSVGDAFLVWPGRFPHGMAAFGAAQVAYVTAFGFQRPRLALGLTLYALGAVLVLLVFPNLKGILVFGVPIYSVLLLTMAWRAMARVSFHRKEECSWTRLGCCAGAILFVISDALIAISQFYTHIPNAQTLIMSTYYAGQLGIALSVLDAETKTDELRNHKSK